MLLYCFAAMLPLTMKMSSTFTLLCQGITLLTNEYDISFSSYEVVSESFHRNIFSYHGSFSAHSPLVECVIQFSETEIFSLFTKEIDEKL